MTTQPTEPGTLCRLKPLVWTERTPGIWICNTVLGEMECFKYDDCDEWSWCCNFMGGYRYGSAENGAAAKLAAGAHYRERISEAVEFIESPQEAPPEPERIIVKGRECEFHRCTGRAEGLWVIRSADLSNFVFLDHSGDWGLGDYWPTREAAEQFAREVNQ